MGCLPKKSTGDYAFVLHMLEFALEGGRMGVVLATWGPFRGGSEGKIRQKIVEMNLLDAVIGLPANLVLWCWNSSTILIFPNKIESK